MPLLFRLAVNNNPDELTVNDFREGKPVKQRNWLIKPLKDPIGETLLRERSLTINERESEANKVVGENFFMLRWDSLNSFPFLNRNHRHKDHKGSCGKAATKRIHSELSDRLQCDNLIASLN